MDNQSFAYSTNSSQPTGSVVENRPLPTENLVEPKTKTSVGIIVGLIVAIVLAVGLAILSVFLFLKYQESSTNLDNQINEAVAIAVKEKADAMELEFSEREKSPYETFAGPADYGELSFKYPKTWSVYINQDAASGGNFEAFLNPSEVNPVSHKETVHALRVYILDSSFDKVSDSYKSLLTKGSLTMQAVTVNGQSANRYEGTFSDGLKGVAVILKIRDKTAVLRTDSDLFANDFNNILSTVQFNS